MKTETIWLPSGKTGFVLSKNEVKASAKTIIQVQCIRWHQDDNTKSSLHMVEVLRN